MICLTTGRAVRRLLNDVREHPDRVSHFVICSPFLDRDLLPLVVDLARRAGRAGCSMRFITTEAIAAMVREATTDPVINRNLSVVACPRLHAKAYVRVDRAGRSEAIVTSANLTRAGIDGNVELGVHASAASAAGLRLIGDLRRILERVTYPNANVVLY